MIIAFVEELNHIQIYRNPKRNTHIITYIVQINIERQ